MERAPVDLGSARINDWGWNGEGPSRAIAVGPGLSRQTDWRFEGEDAVGRVEWTVDVEPGGARISLVHHGFGPDRQWPQLGYVWGWADFLQALALYLEGAGASNVWRGPVSDSAAG